MCAVQEISPLDRVRPRVSVMDGVRQELLAVRKMLLHSVQKGSSFPVGRTTGTGWQWLVSVVAAQRAYTTLRDVERTLDCMQDAGYGLCRGCRNDIPVSRLSVHPQATLCVGCINERLDLLAADAL